MFEGLLGEGEVVGALSRDVDQNLGMPFNDHHSKVPHGPNEGRPITNFIDACLPKLVGIREKPSSFIEGDQGHEWGGQGGFGLSC